MTTCKDCQNSRKRSSFDFKKYGNYGFPYECLKEKNTTYKRPTDTCEKAKEVEKKGGMTYQ